MSWWPRPTPARLLAAFVGGLGLYAVGHAINPDPTATGDPGARIFPIEIWLAAAWASWIVVRWPRQSRPAVPVTEPPARPRPTTNRPAGLAFNEWLRAQLRAKRMSQRQLAQVSGVSQSTISSLVRGDRSPTLGVATKIARGLREVDEPDEAPESALASWGRTTNATARVEYSLRADDALAETQVRQVMEYYLAVRMRRLVRTAPEGVRQVRSEFAFEGFTELPDPFRGILRQEFDPRRRRALIEVFGLEKYTQAVGQIIDTDLDSAGAPRRLWRAGRPGDAALSFVEVVNSTPESDGTQTHHWLRVPPNMLTCRQAVAWTFDLPAGQYQPELET